MEERTRSRTAVKFAESGRPPWWLRLLAVGLACVAVGGGALVGGSDGAAGGAAGATIILIGWGLGLELGQALYGGVRVDATRLWVGKRSVPLAALDLDTLRFEAGFEIYAVFARGHLLSNPMWLPDTVAIDGHSAEKGPVRVVVRTARRDELVAVLREGAAA